MSATSSDVTRESRVTLSVSHAGSHAPVTESRPVPSRPVPKSVVAVVFERGYDQLQANGDLGPFAARLGLEIER